MSDRAKKLLQALNEEPVQRKIIERSPAESAAYSTPLEQLNLSDTANAEFLDSIITEMAKEERWDVLLLCPNCRGNGCAVCSNTGNHPFLKKLIFLEFDNTDVFLDNERPPRSCMFLPSPVPYSQLVKHFQAPVPDIILAEAQLGAVETVEVGRDVSNIVFAVPISSDWHVEQARKGRLDQPIVTSNEEVVMLERLADKGFLFDRVSDKLITTLRTDRSIREELINGVIDAAKLGQIYAVETLLKGAAPKSISSRLIIWVLIGIGLLVVLAALLATGVIKL